MSMQTKNDFLNLYNVLKEELIASNELWRLKYSTQTEFENALDEIFVNFKSGNFLNDFHREQSCKSSIGILLQKIMTSEEMKAQMERSKNEAKESFKQNAPQIKLAAKKIQTPLTISELSHIYRWIFREQIVLSDLSESVRSEFEKSKQFQSLVDRDILPDD